MTDEKTTQSQESTAPAQEGVELNISDLAAVKSIIDVASQRGAFRANEMEAVGKTYNKLSAFLDSITKKD